jgi:regulator of protease activity HflC (stomatin/prohibitin superfamily)
MDGAGWVFGGIVLVLGCVFAGCWGYPQYGVYSQRLEGEAELAKANYSKQVAVQEANAKKDSASLLAEAEVARAEGVAKANKIIGDSLKGNEGYLRYLWISEMKETKDQVIYVPTETNLPILESTRLLQKRPESDAGP